MKSKIGLFAGGIEQYWTEAGMKRLPQILDADAKRLADALSEDFEVVYPDMVGNVADARRVGKITEYERTHTAPCCPKGERT